MKLNLLSDQTPFLKISPDSVSLDDVPTIIFAPNGAGKTTLFRNLVGNHADLAIPYIYDEDMSITYKKLEGKKAKFTINPAPANYEAAHQKCAALIDKLSLEAQIKTVFGSVSNAKKFCPAIVPYSKSKGGGTIQAITILTNEQRVKLKPLLENPGDVARALRDYSAISTLGEDEKRADAWLATHSDIVAAINYVHLDEHKEEIDKNGCPFCGGRGRSGNPYQDLKDTFSNLTAKKMLVFRDYAFLNGVFDAQKAAAMIDSVSEGLSTLSSEQVVSLCFTLGQSDKEAEIKKNIDELDSAREEEQKLSTIRDAKYGLMVEASEYTKKAFSRTYPGAELRFDDDEKTLTIVMPRSPASYSEGEKHDIYRTIMNLSAIGSTKEIVLIDDPLTEFDAANEYKAVFSFVRMVRDAKKKPIVFSCNATLVNLATKYDAKSFKLLYMDSRKTTDGIEVCLIDLKLESQPKTGYPYLSLKNIKADSPASTAERIVNLVVERAVLAENDGTLPGEAKIKEKEASSLLHYDSSFASDTFGLANDDLVDYVESFAAPKADASFVEMAREKLALLASMRVYLEKQLFEYDLVRERNRLQKCLAEKKLTLFQKIDAADLPEDFPIRNMYPKWDRKALLEMKALLNDAEHPFGLIHPLHFALSISWDTLMEELNSLKTLFE